MKKWNVPEISEMTLAETEYGGKKVAKADYVYVNEEGNWEATFVPES